MNSLWARDQNNTRGFTIVELLIVIVVIAILAAITIVAYNGVQRQAAESVMKGDLRNATNAVESANSTQGTYPSTLADAGFTASSGNAFQYTVNGSTFCISVTRSGSNPFNYSSTLGKINDGLCTGHGIANVTTFAGSTDGYNNATGTAAQFNSLNGVDVGPDGTIYVAETFGNRIRKITPDGAVTLLAGSTTGASGATNDNGALARFSAPQDVAVDAAGNVFVAETGNDRIRRITPTGDVTTWAGSTVGAGNGIGTAAQFDNPFSLDIDAAGNIYVAESGNDRIRKILPDQTVSTYAGSTAGFANGISTAAQFNNPYAVAVDAAGIVYVADATNHRIRKILTNQDVSTLAGSTSGYTDATGAAAQFNSPQGIAVDSSGANIYVSDNTNQRIRKVTSAGVVTTFAGSTIGSADGTGSAAQFYYPWGIAIAPDDSTLYVADSFNYRVRKLTQ